MDARRTVSVLRRWLWLLVACVLLAGGAAFLVSNSLQKMYEGKVTLIVGQSLQSVSPDYNQLLASQRLSQTYADLVTTSPLLSRVIIQQGLDTTPDELRKLVRAEAPRDSTLLTISVTDPDPVRVAAIANSIANELIAASPAISGRNSDVSGSSTATSRPLRARSRRPRRRSSASSGRRRGRPTRRIACRCSRAGWSASARPTRRSSVQLHERQQPPHGRRSGGPARPGLRARGCSSTLFLGCAHRPAARGRGRVPHGVPRRHGEIPADVEAAPGLPTLGTICG